LTTNNAGDLKMTTYWQLYVMDARAVKTQVNSVTVCLAAVRAAVRLHLGMRAHVLSQVRLLSELSATGIAQVRLGAGMNALMHLQALSAPVQLPAHRASKLRCTVAFGIGYVCLHVIQEHGLEHELLTTHDASDRVLTMKTHVQFKCALHGE